MSESRVSSVIQEWSYPGQAPPQAHHPAPSAHQGSSSQLPPQMDLLPYGQAPGLMRGVAEDRVAEQMMGLSYQPYASSCLRTAGGAASGQQQSHSGPQQVRVPSGPPRPHLPPPDADFPVFSTSRTSPCSFSRL